MVEINNQTFKEGDIVRFENATLPESRHRKYEINRVIPGVIEASANGFDYQFTLATAARIGITHATEQQGA
ncbi:hypothetical protein ACFWGI_35555 [Streptomyces niveus]|uniref:hypothetical protein n=1 Tax=Streptomyces niveus TaxID=193462 RepID=UPI003669B233